jgi:hypothetical protein
MFVDWVVIISQRAGKGWIFCLLPLTFRLNSFNSAFTSGDLQALCLVLLKAYNDFFEKLAKVAS